MTGQEAFNRLFWDPRLNREAFVVGFADRLAEQGTREMPLPRWAVQAQVPWHRLQYIRCGAVVLWLRDRPEGRLSGDDLPPEAWAAPQATPEGVAPPPDLCPRTVYRPREGSWQALSPAPPLADERELTVITWNVLADFDDQGPADPARLRRVVRAIEGWAFDILALQEATPALLGPLLDLAQIRGWYTSEAAGGAHITPLGLLLLSRWPFELAEHLFSPHRRALVGTWPSASRTLHVACIHLTSNRVVGAAAERQQQLEWVLTHLQRRAGEVLLVGDFNLAEEELADLPGAAGFQDVWLRLRPGQPGFTFDPRANPLAQGRARGRQARYDRVLQRQPSALTPRAIDLLPHPFAGQALSDHRALRAAWQTGPP